MSMQQSYLHRLIRTAEEEDRAVFIGPDARGHRMLAEYRGDRFDPPLVLDFTEEEFDAAVREAGPDGRSLWPEVPEPEGGFRLLLVNLYESLSGMKRPTRRIYVSRGQLWAE
jgi:hypothetical protein